VSAAATSSSDSAINTSPDTSDVLTASTLNIGGTRWHDRYTN
jgi:hypothetical protein